uniref:Androgen-induced gene 1 protein n=1 Tax=Varanus komodoensis TaxID=61221 RepID=A0A8D2IVL9_VARKO
GSLTARIPTKIFSPMLICIFQGTPLLSPVEERINKNILKLKNIKMATVSISVAFWGLYAYDRELIYPAELDAINPSWLNHSMHTTILPLLVVELVICAHKYPPSILSNLWFLTIIFIFVYRIFWVHHVGGIWAYPILGVLGPCEKAIFLICAVCVMITFYFLGEQLTKWLWGK